PLARHSGPGERGGRPGRVLCKRDAPRGEAGRAETLLSGRPAGYSNGVSGGGPPRPDAGRVAGCKGGGGWWGGSASGRCPHAAGGWPPGGGRSPAPAASAASCPAPATCSAPSWTTSPTTSTSRTPPAASSASTRPWPATSAWTTPPG